jgi:DNA modification methylase
MSTAAPQHAQARPSEHGRGTPAPVEDWRGCYDASWRGVIVDGAFAHPAKFAPGLVRRILSEGLVRGWWARGQVIGDPFGGIGGGGLAAADAGLKWVGVELEPRFVALGRQNFAKNSGEWAALGRPAPVLLEGDSRRFAELVRAAGIVTSPPYAETLSHGGGPDTKHDLLQGGKSLLSIKEGYGVTAGQIGELPAGCVDGCVDGIATSPPYASGDTAGPESLGKRTDAAAQAMRGVQNWGTGGQVSPANIAAEGGETYWQAMAQVYAQCAAALRPHGVMAVVMKDYVKKGARVPLCDQTLALLVRLGFEPVLRARAWLVEERVELTLAGEVTRTRERKSFFRRLAEKKGSPRIDWEEVIVVRRAV